MDKNIPFRLNTSILLISYCDSLFCTAYHSMASRRFKFKDVVTSSQKAYKLFSAIYDYLRGKNRKCIEDYPLHPVPNCYSKV